MLNKKEKGKIEMMVDFKNYLGKMPLEDKIRSIFDTMVAGNFADDGIYYCIHTDHKTHKKYALTREAEEQADMLGYTLDKGQQATFNGEKVRAMTDHEERLWNEGNLMEHVDMWGNIAVEEEFDIEWYMDNLLYEPFEN